MTHLSYSSLCEHSFKFFPKPLNKWCRDFVIDVLWLFLSIKSSVNFLQLGRYGEYDEQRYRQQFEGSFDSFNFNAALINQYCGQRSPIAFDQATFPNQIVKPKALAGFGQVVPIKQNGA